MERYSHRKVRRRESTPLFSAPIKVTTEPGDTVKQNIQSTLGEYGKVKHLLEDPVRLLGISSASSFPKSQPTTHHPVFKKPIHDPSRHRHHSSSRGGISLKQVDTKQPYVGHGSYNGLPIKRPDERVSGAANLSRASNISGSGSHSDVQVSNPASSSSSHPSSLDFILKVMTNVTEPLTAIAPTPIIEVNTSQVSNSRVYCPILDNTKESSTFNLLSSPKVTSPPPGLVSPPSATPHQQKQYSLPARPSSQPSSTPIVPNQLPPTSRPISPAYSVPCLQRQFSPVPKPISPPSATPHQQKQYSHPARPTYKPSATSVVQNQLSTPSKPSPSTAPCLQRQFSPVPKPISPPSATPYLHKQYSPPPKPISPPSATPRLQNQYSPQHRSIRLSTTTPMFPNHYTPPPRPISPPSLTPHLQKEYSPPPRPISPPSLTPHLQKEYSPPPRPISPPLPTPYLQNQYSPPPRPISPPLPTPYLQNQYSPPPMPISPPPATPRPQKQYSPPLEPEPLPPAIDYPPLQRSVRPFSPLHPVPYLQRDCFISKDNISLSGDNNQASMAVVPELTSPRPDIISPDSLKLFKNLPLPTASIIADDHRSDRSTLVAQEYPFPSTEQPLLSSYSDSDTEIKGKIISPKNPKRRRRIAESCVTVDKEWGEVVDAEYSNKTGMHDGLQKPSYESAKEFKITNGKNTHSKKHRRKHSVESGRTAIANQSSKSSLSESICRSDKKMTLRPTRQSGNKNDGINHNEHKNTCPEGPVRVNSRKSNNKSADIFKDVLNDEISIPRTQMSDDVLMSAASLADGEMGAPSRSRHSKSSIKRELDKNGSPPKVGADGCAVEDKKKKYTLKKLFSKREDEGAGGKSGIHVVKSDCDRAAPQVLTSPRPPKNVQQDPKNQEQRSATTSLHPIITKATRKLSIWCKIDLNKLTHLPNINKICSRQGRSEPIETNKETAKKSKRKLIHEKGECNASKKCILPVDNCNERATERKEEPTPVLLSNCSSLELMNRLQQSPSPHSQNRTVSHTRPFIHSPRDSSHSKQNYIHDLDSKRKERLRDSSVTSAKDRVEVKKKENSPMKGLIFFSYYEDVEETQLPDKKELLSEAIRLKQIGDIEKDDCRQCMVYLEAAMCYVLTASVLENESDTESAAFNLYHECLKLLGESCFKPALNQETSRVRTRVAALRLRCQSLVHLKLFRLKKEEVRETKRTADEHFQQTPPSYITSPMHTSVATPLHVHDSFKKQNIYMTSILSSYDIWDECDALVKKSDRVKEFFIQIDRSCGPLTFHSSIKHLVKYVRFGISRLKKEAT